MLQRLLMLTICAVLALPCLAQDEPANLVANPGFEEVTDGQPDGWVLTPGGNDATLAAVELDDGGHALKLDCTRFERGWVITAQDSVVKVRKGHYYRLTFRARTEGLKAGCSVATFQREPWKNCGLGRGFVPGSKWMRYEMGFVGTLDADDTRFEFYFSATGTMYLDDIVLTESERPMPTSTLVAAPGKNCIRNASFELGEAWWGSDGSDVLNGETVPDGVDGERCLRVEVDPATADVYWEDWYEVERYPVLAGSAVAEGWFPVTEGERYCFSAWLRSDTLPMRASLRVRSYPKGGFAKTFDITDEWQRFEVSGEMGARICCAWITIEDLPRRTTPIPEGAGPWRLLVDGVQLEPGDAATDFAPRHPVEIALATDRPGNVFTLPDAPTVDLLVHNASADAVDETVTVVALDAWDEAATEVAVRVQVPAGGSVTAPVELDVSRGFFRARASLGGANADLRIALVDDLRERIAGKPGRFGINHASPSDLRMDLWQLGGMSWVRDWSYKWEQMQPTEGADFDFSLQDPQIDRCLDRGMNVLLCLPESSTLWTTTAPRELIDEGGRKLWTARKYPPTDHEQYAAYIAAVVEHTRGRVEWFEIMNEPNHLIVPPEAYCEILQSAHEAAKGVDPAAMVIGGKGGGATGSFGWYQGIMQGGALSNMDALNLHIYLGASPPRGMEDGLVSINEEMDANGGRRPIWITEWLYGADDDAMPTVADWPPTGRVQTELEATRMNLKYYVVGMANGVELFFQHTSHWPTRMNTPSLLFDSFFEYRAAPRKAFAGHNAMVSLLGSNPMFAARLELGDDGYGAAFERDGGGSAVVVWRERWGEPVPLVLADLPAGCVPHDMMGVIIMPDAVLELGAAPVYILSDDLPPDRLAREVQRALGG